MSIDTHGYNGVFEAVESLVNRMLAGSAYENNLIKTNGIVNDADFLNLPFDSFRVYLLTGRPSIIFENHDGTNLVTITIPFFGLSVYQLSPAASTALPLNLGGEGVGIQVSDIGLKLDNGTLKLDLTRVTKDSIAFFLFAFVNPPTNVGGQAQGQLMIPDLTLGQYLTDAGVGAELTPVILRTQIAAALSGGTLAPVSFPLRPGGLQPELSQTDLITIASVAGANPAAFLGFFDVVGDAGTITDAVDMVPNYDEPPSYTWSASLTADVARELLDDVFTSGDYLDQSLVKKPNTPDLPHGFMSVPAAGQSTFSVPKKKNCVTVSASSGGKVTVVVAGGFLHHARGNLLVLNKTAKQSFEVDGTGSASLSIAASAGDHLALQIYATPGSDPSAVLWKPKVTFQDGSLRFDFHYYYYLTGPCDLEGDGYIVAEPYADRTKMFMLGMKVTDSNFDIPLWAGAFDFFFVNVAGSALLYTEGETLARILIDPQSKLNNLLASNPLQVPQAPGVATFLDYTATFADGIVLSGRADSGSILSAGRHTVNVSYGIIGFVYNSFNQNNFLVTNSGGKFIVSPICPAIFASGKSASDFWSATLDDIPLPPFTAAPVPLSPGDQAVFFVDTRDGLGKVLLELPPINADEMVRITWIIFTKRVVQSVAIQNNIAATLIGSTSTGFLLEQYFSYAGYLSLDRVKFFLTSDTFLAGQEQWQWDGVDIPLAGLTIPGGSVSHNPDRHRVYVQIAPTQAGPPDAGSHTVTFKGTDVFGRTQSATITIQTPVRRIEFKPLLSGVSNRLIDPWGPFENSLVEISNVLGASIAATVAANLALLPLAQTLANAVKNGSAALAEPNISQISKLGGSHT